MSESPAIRVRNKKAQEVLRKISEGIDLPSDDLIRRIEAKVGADESIDDLTDADIEELGDELFYSWYSHYEYIKGLNEIGSLILGIAVPPSIERFVGEAKSCYAFQQYNAVYSLCRTIIEFCVRDICLRRGLIPKRHGSVTEMAKYRWVDLRNKVSSGSLNRCLDDLYGRISTLIHGRKTVNQEEAKQIFQDTLKMMHQLYSHHEL